MAHFVLTGKTTLFFLNTFPMLSCLSPKKEWKAKKKWAILIYFLSKNFEKGRKMTIEIISFWMLWQINGIQRNIFCKKEKKRKKYLSTGLFLIKIPKNTNHTNFHLLY